VPFISLRDALLTLIEDVRAAGPGRPDDGVEIDLSVVAEAGAHRPTWLVATAGDTGTHRIRLTVYPWRDTPPGPDRIPPGTGFPADIPIGIDPRQLPGTGTNRLPPIVRPKPGIEPAADADRHGD
jgi:hypothetical protein